ncbi:RDD family protein [Massilia sp. CF038]|uniref:RDD family protein n=1 Tax=Massilia sp. CF038 TaxID=1881045 RepID=UPI0009193B6C|nr:RDD family protein [Massilia sp. CF038]SHG49179.1 RDD family protein [Massilia sp. CF038]
MPTDPYAPPQSAVGGFTRAEQDIRDNGGQVIASAGQRLAASLIDFAIVLPLVALDLYLASHTRWSDLYMLLPYYLATIFLSIVMVRTYGGSPGKLLLGMRIVMLDGSAVTWKASVLRFSVYLMLELAISASDILTAFAMPDDSYLALDHTARIEALETYAPWWSDYPSYAVMLWMLACAITLLANQRRRTLYDYQAGTIVVRVR